MNQIVQLYAHLSKKFPRALFEVDVPVDEMGVWHLDIKDYNTNIYVEWHAKKYNEFVLNDEYYTDYDSVLNRLVTLLRIIKEEEIE